MKGAALRFSQSILLLLLALQSAAASEEQQSCTLPAASTMRPTIRKVPAAKLGVSEPNPRMFGNPANEPGNPKWTNANWLKSHFHFSFAE